MNFSQKEEFCTVPESNHVCQSHPEDAPETDLWIQSAIKSSLLHLVIIPAMLDDWCTRKNGKMMVSKTSARKSLLHLQLCRRLQSI